MITTEKQYLILGMMVFAIVLLIIVLKILSRHIMIRKALKLPFLSTKSTNDLVKNYVERQEKAEPIKKYNDFAAFCSDLPAYSIKEDYANKIVRNALILAGMKFKQFVYIDKNTSTPKTAWMRWTGKVLSHEKGEYYPPFDCGGYNVIFYDVNDARPLIDKTKDHDWKDPEMNADLVAARHNANVLKNFQRAENQMLYILIGMAVIAVIVIATWYMTNTKIDGIATQAMQAIDAAKKN